MTNDANRPEIDVMPADQVAWSDVEVVFATRGDPEHCWCQWFMLDDAAWRAGTDAERAAGLRAQVEGERGGVTAGLVAYVDGEPVGWCAVGPRTWYPRLARARVPWTGRDEDRADATVWAVTCFVTRAQFRRRGVSRALLRAAVDHAAAHGARALEGYPRVATAQSTAEQLYVGTPEVFADAGFVAVSHPTPRRVVMRRELTSTGDVTPTSDPGSPG